MTFKIEISQFYDLSETKPLKRIKSDVFFMGHIQAPYLSLSKNIKIFQ